MFSEVESPKIAPINETMLIQRHNVAFHNYDFIRNDKIENEPGRGLESL